MMNCMIDSESNSDLQASSEPLKTPSANNNNNNKRLRLREKLRRRFASPSPNTEASSSSSLKARVASVFGVRRTSEEPPRNVYSCRVEARGEEEGAAPRSVRRSQSSKGDRDRRLARIDVDSVKQKVEEEMRRVKFTGTKQHNW